MKAYFIHGMNVRDSGEASMDKLADIAREAEVFEEVVELDYPWFGLFRVKLCNETAAYMIADLVEPGHAVFCHSNGAAIIYRAVTQYGARFRYACLLNAALRSDTTIPHADFVDTWWSPDDVPTLLARWTRFFVPSFWGAQGRTGYTGRCKTHFNHRMPHVGHTGVFRHGWLMRKIVQTAADRLGLSG